MIGYAEGGGGVKKINLGGMEKWNESIGHFRFSFSQFLIAIAALFLTAPYVSTLPHAPLIQTSLMTVVMFSALIAIGGRRRSLVIAVLLAIPAFVAKWLYHFLPSSFPHVVGFMAETLFVSFVVFRLLRFILRMPEVNFETICAAISAYLMIGVLWGLIYAFVENMHPGSFVFTVGHATDRRMSGMNGIYFSFVTLATVGYGDIIPLSPMARTLAVIEAMCGMFYITVLIARLVAVYSSSKRTLPREPHCHCACHEKTH